MSFSEAIPLIAALLFGLVSGFNDGGNLMASFTSGRVITPRLWRVDGASAASLARMR